jgi:N-methylhydantoinase B
MMGGYPGAVNRYRFLRDSDIAERMKRSELVRDVDELTGKAETLQLRQENFLQHPHDVYAVLWSAAGGFGDPLERDPAKVAADVANGDVSTDSAKKIYGVIIGDADATAHERNSLRKQRLQKATAPFSPAKPLGGKETLRATETLAVRGGHWCCAKCAADLGPLKENYKERCARSDLPIQASNPLVGDPRRFIDPLPQFRQFACPSCGTLIENEIAVAEDPVLRDVEILGAG